MDNKYIIELFNTDYVLVSRKTDDDSTYTQSLRKRMRIHNGYTEILRLSNFEKHYDTPILDQIIELFENFVQHSKILITSRTPPIHYEYFDDHDDFLIELLNKKDYSNLKKWCVLHSALLFFDRKVLAEHKEFIFNVLEKQVDPEKVQEWHSIEQSANYLSPAFSLQLKQNYIDDKEKTYNKIKTIDEYNDHITIVNFLKNPKCNNLEEAEKTGFVHYDAVLSDEESVLTTTFISKKYLFKFLKDVSIEKMMDILPYLQRIPKKIHKELLPFVIYQILTSDLTGALEHNSQRLFLNEFDYEAFLKTADRILEEEQSKIRKPTEFSYFENPNNFNLWISMAKLFLENNVEEFSDFFREWMNLINEEKNDQLSHPVFIQENFQASLENNLPVRYLYHLNA